VAGRVDGVRLAVCRADTLERLVALERWEAPVDVSMDGSSVTLRDCRIESPLFRAEASGRIGLPQGTAWEWAELLIGDDFALAVDIDLPDTSDGRDLAVLMERGDISGMSFGFSVTKETWDETSSLPLRTIQAVDLIEVSAVARPAYPDTSIAMRSLEGVRQIARSRNFNAAANRVGMKVSIDLRMRGLMSKA
jgi:hypothetical protein